MVNSRMKALDRKNEVATWIANASADRTPKKNFAAPTRPYFEAWDNGYFQGQLSGYDFSSHE